MVCHKLVEMQLMNWKADRPDDVSMMGWGVCQFSHRISARIAPLCKSRQGRSKQQEHRRPGNIWLGPCVCAEMSQMQSMLGKSFVRQCFLNTREEQVFSILKNLQVTVISKVFYKYSFVSGRHLFPANTARCDATGSLRSGSGLLRKLIFCTYMHLVKAKHVLPLRFWWRLTGCLGVPLCPYLTALSFLWIEPAQILGSWNFSPSVAFYSLTFQACSIIILLQLHLFLLSLSLMVLFYTLEYEFFVPGFIRYS